jgi:HK97 family phage portal protein
MNLLPAATRRALSATAAAFGAWRLKASSGTLVPARSAGLFGLVRESFTGAWQKNVECDTRDGLLAFSAVYACISRIASDIAKLPIMLVEASDDGTWPLAVSTSPFWGVLRKPNRYQTRIQFLMVWIVSKLIYGNTYVWKERDARGIVTALYVLDARRVTALVAEDGQVYYQLNSDPLSGLPDALTVPASEIIHDLMNPLFHPLVGIAPIYACAASATQGNRIQANSATFFQNMSRPSGVLTAPGTIDDATAKRLKETAEPAISGQNIGRLLVAGDGLKYEAMTIPAMQAQLIEQLGWTVEDVARAFGVPLYKINAGPMPTNNNVEALNEQYYTGCLQILMESIEVLLDEGCALPVGYRTQFDLAGLLRMDTTARYDAWNKAVMGGWMSPDEARQRENLAPVAGGDTPYMQQQNWALAQLAKRNILDKPAVAPPPAVATDPNAEPKPSDPNADPKPDPNAAPTKPNAKELDLDDPGTQAIWMRGARAIFKEQLYATR